MEKDFIYKIPERATPDNAQQMLAVCLKHLNETESGNTYIDFSNAQTINSFGVGVLVRLNNLYTGCGRTFILKNLPDSIIETFMAMGLFSVLNIELNDPELRKRLKDSEVGSSFKVDFEIVKNIGIYSFNGSMLTPKDSHLFLGMTEAILADGFRMLLDMSGLVFIDSTGISAIATLCKLMKHNKGEIRVCSAGEILTGLLEINSLSGLIHVYETRAEALKGWV
ncbi:MAG: hypothetical protein A2268_10770 [Candidatus Raymondbacteria bacterium RifOxyA12_full_50_37]|uniref:STAS domain-containing protein n=1 Tax=Candidatus Raymondbacteria bacterium RIFOXYD12_FULL_49_13 TaxID=1817890 RepID=A0A1F7F8T1_UNCRA|nr:MAG: hypothetical protein A2268_10770 [Candidatus Raymondbacteria bacterium RifOxyA12_full_50_37]OGJ85445.1 MAG: hypothetical protein A2248_12555 [Candidatus Raymondbacteria bacterium RIFOXYA2_FULL_49_16]OGJ94953.1 MAG: hypothetical protein A2453_08025 [Candidatus Raymondbacteria bacterium RIFOXYC2_FULL_50_21]OGK02820.1 MAG: hypothetical protein A2487_16170 [Candidatus Raymondbacteria bacterium RifOxyC12_full_50_8]OGK03070.1 MAG: hypothetical protein A2519_21515 [Candidatus Raymondbacteria b